VDESEAAALLLEDCFGEEGFDMVLNVQCLFVQLPEIINEPHLQNSDN